MKRLLNIIRTIFVGSPMPIQDRAEVEHNAIMNQLDTVRTLEDIVFIKNLIRLFEKKYQNETEIVDYYDYHTTQKLKYYRVVRSFSYLHTTLNRNS